MAGIEDFPLGSLLAQASSQPSPAPSPLGVTATVIAVIAAVVGIPTGWFAYQKARLEYRVKVIELEGKLGTGSPGLEVLGMRSPSIAGIEDLIIRFIIFWITLIAWDLLIGVANAATPELFRSGVYFLGARIYPLEVVNVLGRTIIFVLLAIPLLRDILGALGVGFLDLFRRRTK